MVLVGSRNIHSIRRWGCGNKDVVHYITEWQFGLSQPSGIPEKHCTQKKPRWAHDVTVSAVALHNSYRTYSPHSAEDQSPYWCCLCSTWPRQLATQTLQSMQYRRADSPYWCCLWSSWLAPECAESVVYTDLQLQNTDCQTGPCTIIS